MSLPFNPQQEIAETRLLMVQAIAQNKARRLASQLPAAAADPLKPRQPCVMLVEDLAVNQLLFKKILEKAGCRVVIAHNGLQAVELFPTADWDLILMDMVMPTMSGLQATVLIRYIEETESCRVPIVGVSANVSVKDLQACTDAGMDDFLPKPINLPDLRAVLVKYCALDAQATIPASL